MIEPSDILLDKCGHSENPEHNNPEPSDKNFKGAVRFLDKPNKETVVKGHMFLQIVRMGGERPITVTMEEMNDRGKWKPIKNVKAELTSGWCAFLIEIKTQDLDTRTHALRYIATNSLGSVTFEQDLKVLDDVEFLEDQVDREVEQDSWCFIL